MRFLLIALTLTASAALAQTTPTVSLTLPNAADTIIQIPGTSEVCTQERVVNWAVNTTGTICSDLRFWIVAGSSCPDEPATGTEELPRVTQSTLASTRSAQIRFTIDEDLPLFQGTDAATCPAAEREEKYRLCAALKLGTAIFPADPCSTTSVQKDDFEIVYDSKPPDVPTIESVTPLDSALSVRVDTSDEDANRFRLYISRADGTGARTMTQSTEKALFTVENLENGVTYSITATSLDAVDNESAATDPQTGTPIFTRGFFDNYVNANGQETGGCGAAAGGLAGGWVLAVLGFWLSSRRNRS